MKIEPIELCITSNALQNKNRPLTVTFLYDKQRFISLLAQDFLGIILFFSGWL